MAYREILERQMAYERFLIRQFRERLEQCPPGYLQHRRRRGENGGEAVYDQYYHKLPGVATPQYLNQKMAPLINELKYKRMLEESIRRLEQNVKARERYLGDCKPFDYASVSGCLLKVRYADFTMPIAPWFPFYMEYKGLYQKEEILSNPKGRITV